MKKDLVFSQRALGALLAVSMFPIGSAQAVTTTADYTAGPNGVAGGDVVTFDTYDFAPGALLLEDADTVAGGSPIAPAVGDVYNGFLQTFVVAHFNVGALASASGLNSNYELTLVAEFSETIGVVAVSNVEFDLNPGGTVALYLGAPPNSTFTGDSGFDDGNAILTGTISGGFGSFVTLPTFSLGSTSIDVDIDFSDPSIFAPPIAGGESAFTLQLNKGAALGTVLSVQGNQFNCVVPGSGETSECGSNPHGTDILLVADGNFVLQPVPVPPAVWLFGSGLLGLVGIARRRKG